MTSIWMSMVLTLLVMLLLIRLPMTSFAEEPDFYLKMLKCKTAVGYLVPSDDSLKILDGTPTTNACRRRSKKITCDLAFDDKGEGHRGAVAEYQILLDSPPHLHFSDDTAGDWFAVNTSTHTVVMVTRIVGEQFLASKACQGIFATQNEVEELSKKRKEPAP